MNATTDSSLTLRDPTNSHRDDTPLTIRTVSIITPFYNEADSISFFFERVVKIIESCPSFRFEFICINDGSADHTLQLLLAQHTQSSPFTLTVIDLSRNFGKEAAMTAGLDHASGDAAIFMDADLQDPPELIPEMLRAWNRGTEVVLAKRVDRSTDSLPKRYTAALFYKIHNLISDIKIPENVGDFRLIDRKVMDAIIPLRERQRFMKGIFAWVGFSTETITYSREKRVASSSKFNSWRLWNFALEGITSFSTIPLKIWTYLGAAGAIFSLAFALYITIRTFAFGIDVPGYASIMVSVLFLGSVQILGIGVLGEYIGRIYQESKQRPLYVIRNILRRDQQ